MTASQQLRATAAQCRNESEKIARHDRTKQVLVSLAVIADALADIQTSQHQVDGEKSSTRSACTAR